MEWLDSLVQKWNQFRERVQPGLAKTGSVCKKMGKDLTFIGSYLYKLRAIILVAPVAAVAAVLASINMAELPEIVEITKLTLDTKAADSLFGCLVIGVDYISREQAVLVPLVLTIGCLLLTLCSKRTLYPWLISVFSLALPLLLRLCNTFML